MRIHNLNEASLRPGWMVARLPASLGPEVSVLAACFFVKGTFRLNPGRPADAWPGMPEICSGDKPVEGAQDQGISYASDFVPFKPFGEFTAFATAHRPPDTPGGSFPASIRIGGKTKALKVFGPREWKMGMLSSRPGEARPAETVPITYAYAFGGPRYAHNPIGRGAEGISMHQIEELGHPVESPHAMVEPAGFCPLPATWPQRHAKIGTYKGRWAAERWPWPAEDLQLSYYNAAPASQWIDGYWKGDEEVEMLNLHPSYPEYRSQLPGLRARCFIEREPIADEAEFREVPLFLDTLWIDAHLGKLILVWRGHVPTRSMKLRDIAHLLLFTEPMTAEPRPLEACRVAMLQAIEAKKMPYPEAVPWNPSSARQEIGGRLGEVLAATQAAKAEAATHLKDLAAQIRQSPPQMPPGQSIEPLLAILDNGGNSPAVPDAVTPSAADAFKELKASLESIDLGAVQDPELRHKLSGTLEGMMEQAEAASKQASGPSSPKRKTPDIERVLATTRDFRGMNLDNADLSGLDLAGVNFAGASLRQANLCGSSLRAANLSGARLEEANLSRADLTAADLDGAVLEKAEIRGAVWEKASLSRVSFRGMDLRDARFGGAKGVETDFSGADLREASFQEVSFSTADFSSAVLDDADFSGATLHRAFFSGASARNIRMQGADLTNLRARGASDFSGGQFQQSSGDGSVWKFSVLDGANFEQSSLNRADFSEASLVGCMFDRCILKSANFSDSRLGKARLTNANLLRAHFERADLDHAALDGSNLFQAAFWNTSLHGATWHGAFIKRARLGRLV